MCLYVWEQKGGSAIDGNKHLLNTHTHTHSNIAFLFHLLCYDCVTLYIYINIYLFQCSLSLSLSLDTLLPVARRPVNQEQTPRLSFSQSASPAISLSVCACLVLLSRLPVALRTLHLSVCLSSGLTPGC